jgi:hypothetical protein
VSPGGRECWVGSVDAVAIIDGHVNASALRRRERSGSKCLLRSIRTAQEEKVEDTFILDATAASSLGVLHEVSAGDEEDASHSRAERRGNRGRTARAR